MTSTSAHIMTLASSVNAAGVTQFYGECTCGVTGTRHFGLFYIREQALASHLRITGKSATWKD